MTEQITEKDLVAELVELARVRHDLAQATAALDEKRVAWEEAHWDDIDRVSLLKRQAVEFKKRADLFALMYFDFTGEKRPVPGVLIKETDQLDVSEEDATAWARKNAPALLTITDPDTVAAYLRAEHPELLGLDMAAYWKTFRANGMPGMPGRIVKVPQPSIDKDLSAYLEAPDGSDSDDAS
jgi:hypothetical protein